MCKQLCEQTAEGRALWDQWREKHDNWKAVSEYHREQVLAAMVADHERLRNHSGYVVFLCPRDIGKE